MTTMMITDEMVRGRIVDAGVDDFMRPVDLSPLAVWSLKVVNDDDFGLAGVLTHRSGFEVAVENRGNGGENTYSGTLEARVLFAADAEAVFPGEFDAKDLLVLLFELLTV